jgi:hypothetical protein
MTSTQVIRGTRFVVIAAAVAATITLAGCGGKAGKSSNSADSSPSVGIGQIGALNIPSASPSTTSGTGSGSGSGSGSGGGGGGTKSSPTKASSSTTIVYFKVTTKPQCAVVGTTDAPFSQPAQPVTVAWKVTGPATGVALSIDDPTFFSRYGTGSWKSGYKLEDSETLSFPCDTSKANSSHTYTINTTPGGAKSSTITVTVPSNP